METGLAAVSKLLPVLEKELVIFAARPHWGKLFAMSPTELKSRYKRLPDFIQLSKKYDPHGKFRNAFLDRNIFSSYSRFEQRQNRKKF
jgi:xylitol oxidase